MSFLVLSGDELELLKRSLSYLPGDDIAFVRKLG